MNARGEDDRKQGEEKRGDVYTYTIQRVLECLRFMHIRVRFLYMDLWKFWGQEARILYAERAFSNTGLLKNMDWHYYAMHQE